MVSSYVPNKESLALWRHLVQEKLRTFGEFNAKVMISFSSSKIVQRIQSTKKKTYHPKLKSSREGQGDDRCGSLKNLYSVVGMKQSKLYLD